jgi:hypothetical protein
MRYCNLLAHRHGSQAEQMSRLHQSLRLLALVLLLVAGSCGLGACVRQPELAQAKGPFDVTPAQRWQAASAAMQGRVEPDIDEVARARNQTYYFLVRNGVDPQTAEAAVLNPTIMRMVLAEIATRPR